jgi:hypothetical protein
MSEEERIKRLAGEILPSLGHDNCTVICPKAVGVDFVGYVGTAGSAIPKWTIRATDDQRQTCLIELDASPNETEAQIQKKLIESFSSALWKPAPGQSSM